MSNSSGTDYYEQDQYCAIEQAILAEAVTFKNIDNTTEGKFYLRVMTPTMSTSKTVTRSSNGVTSTNYLTLPIPAYLLLQFMTPSLDNLATEIIYSSDSTTRTTKTVITFKSNTFTIPKGTVFFVAFVGGIMTADNAYIIAASTLTYVQ